ncbi:MAG: hypothetical protein FJZ43_02315 [Candidatus Staskawiczbacteria bacterium]|nr:hypothetical protein [Candidatus Staskawiczbacteria bacterium]
MAKENNVNIAELVNNGGCFDLQFRKDTRHERTNSPTYYRWKVQFIITASKDSVKKLSAVKNILNCGNVNVLKNQARFSVQNIDYIKDLVIPFFEKNTLEGNKKKDFQLWKKAVNIVHSNKGININKWEKNDLFSLIEIQKSASKYKNNPREPRWIKMAQTISKSL